jgi:hypothetical protein
MWPLRDRIECRSNGAIRRNKKMPDMHRANMLRAAVRLASTFRRNARMMYATETPAQSGRAFHQTLLHRPEPIRVSVALAPTASGERKTNMAMPAILQGESITRLLQGAAAGAIATLIAGFYWGGWVTAGTAKDMTQRSTTAAVVSALSPICVDKFQRSAEAGANMLELKKVSSYQQGSFIEKGGWATLPGSERADSAVAQACANMLSSLK